MATMSKYWMQDFAGLDVGAVAVAEDGGGQDDGGDAAGFEQLLGALDEKAFDAVVCVEGGGGVGKRVGGAFGFGQGFEKAFDAVGRVGDKDVETVVSDLRVAGVDLDQGVAVADGNVALAVHEGGDLGDFGEPVFFFDTDDGLVIGGDVGLRVGGGDERLDLAGEFGEEVAGATGVVDDFWWRGVLGDEALQRQAHYDEAADGERREVLAFALLDALVEKALEEVAEKLAVAGFIGQADVLPHLDDFQQDFGVLVEQLFVVNVDE
jgi:hypothetical protein